MPSYAVSLLEALALVGSLAPHLDLYYSVAGTEIVTGAGDSLVLKSPCAISA